MCFLNSCSTKSKNYCLLQCEAHLCFSIISQQSKTQTPKTLGKPNKATQKKKLSLFFLSLRVLDIKHIIFL